ncbi:MAG: hypothetical protein IPP61_16180 [Cytophagaceae bacterium]|nr:hypothetical protein [Cytophagaceae bacterium]MBL0303874.1 hypothetical protein [Cytophagaceae bacterium]MBL0326689.1 hypothetical protein [Cytophagaceae bacterium]
MLLDLNTFRQFWFGTNSSSNKDEIEQLKEQLYNYKRLFEASENERELLMKKLIDLEKNKNTSNY